MEGKILFGIVEVFVNWFIFYTFLVSLINNTVLQLNTRTCLTEFAALVCICMYLPDDDLVEVETCRREIRDKE
jgi:hypothetical protein